jgi:hypothetical protein
VGGIFTKEHKLWLRGLENTKKKMLDWVEA